MVQKNKPTQKPLLNPCADPIFKILFTDESKEAHQALTCFLCDILEKNVTDVVLQPNELSGETDQDKQTEFDINCKIDGKFANIEMQNEGKKTDYGKRAEYHVAHILNHYTPRGTEWDEIPQVFQISVLNFFFDNNTRECINHYVLRNNEGRTISNTLNVIFMELPKLYEQEDDVSKLTKAQMWGKFFLYAPKEEKADFVQELVKANGGIKMAFTVLKNISQDEANWQRETHYWMHVADEKTMKKHARQEGLAEGRAEGRVEGRDEKAKETALNLLKMKVLSKEQIAQATGLTTQQIEEL